MPELNFDQAFEGLTGNKPFPWQCRLFELFVRGEIPPIINLPTGMGKTSVMALWFLALEAQTQASSQSLLPTRLIYVVDRRTVVDQATTVAEKLQCHFGGDRLAVSTLRGQFADNRDWTRDPSKPSIVIGTVDMIGSRMLFSGYRSSYKQRPLDAGLLGQDSLLILDEAHLSKPFAKLIDDLGPDGAVQRGQGKPMRCMKMSATSIGAPTDEFRLEESDLKDSPDGSVVLRRYKAKKRLSIHPDIADVKKEIVKKAAELAVDKSRVVVFVRSPEDAQKIADDMRKVASKKGSAHVGVEVLTGTMRGLERDRFLGKPVVRRFLDAESGTADGPVVLVSTSAGEVGFDLNADHLVCDAAPLDSIIQRFGRVNRRGEGAAEVHLFVGRRGEKEESKKAAEDGPPLRAFEAATRKAVEILRQLPSYDDGSFNASPKALDDLDKPDEALSPKPVVVKLTDILLDAWSMTTIVEPMPGRPPVANWLRGIADELPEATISWRAELEIAGFAELDIVDIEEWFDAHRVLPHETLTLPSHKAGQLLRERWMSLGEDRKTKLKNAICIIDQGGLRVVHLVDLMDDLEKKSQSLAINADIILPASFGGIQRGVGMLDPSKPEHAADPSNVADGIDTTADVADETDDARMRRYRLVRTDGDEHPILGELPAGKQCQNLSEFTLDMPTDGDTTRQLVSLVPKRQRPELGTQTQGLADHVVAVVRHAKTMADRLNLQGTPRDALMLAAQWHDQGKARELWQRAVGGNTVNPLAKSAGKMQPIRSGYRHEFGSLRDIMSRAVGEGNTQPEVLDLAAHMVAAHHGRSRPHFPRGGFDPDARPESEAIAAEAMRRFAKLQKKYGWWYLAWLENLLRCADAMASAESTGENGK